MYSGAEYPMSRIFRLAVTYASTFRSSLSVRVFRENSENFHLGFLRKPAVPGSVARINAPTTLLGSRANLSTYSDRIVEWWYEFRERRIELIEDREDVDRTHRTRFIRRLWQFFASRGKSVRRLNKALSSDRVCPKEVSNNQSSQLTRGEFDARRLHRLYASRAYNPNFTFSRHSRRARVVRAALCHKSSSPPIIGASSRSERGATVSHAKDARRFAIREIKSRT